MGIVSKFVWWFIVLIFVLISITFFSLDLSLASIIFLVIAAVLISPIFERIFKIRTWIKIAFIILVLLYLVNYSGLVVPADQIVQIIEEQTIPEVETHPKINNQNISIEQRNETNASPQRS